MGPGLYARDMGSSLYVHIRTQVSLFIEFASTLDDYNSSPFIELSIANRLIKLKSRYISLTYHLFEIEKLCRGVCYSILLFVRMFEDVRDRCKAEYGGQFCSARATGQGLLEVHSLWHQIPEEESAND